MSEKIYQQVEWAIREKLYCARGTRWSGGLAWERPIRIELGNIIMLWGDCGNENRQEDLSEWTIDEWREVVLEDNTGLYRQVGFWQFAPVDDPAVECIRWCNSYPDTAGRELHRLREYVASLTDAAESYAN